ncbi:hypothetical protein [Bradyrhizobium sp. AUGA SZCCT0160]|uniref:hypothetical protein n=1 Tax=Bradyrhizobium sp. AUGA SZCCT0160 TaxID=2807662 RepID=UPI001BA74E9A|nr:hypothetical protein [Bradyrhizobium sp. AUGA SZCCT0160]MBR1190108.1 hypothetical protein [Bradyrhizobium sp. AUGA SZCCT0160]
MADSDFDRGGAAALAPCSLGLLEFVSAVLELIGAVISGVVKLATSVIRRLTGPAKLQP